MKYYHVQTNKPLRSFSMLNSLRDVHKDVEIDIYISPACGVTLGIPKQVKKKVLTKFSEILTENNITITKTVIN